MTMKLVNLCPHTIHIHTPTGLTIDVPESGMVARLFNHFDNSHPRESIMGIPVVKILSGEVKILVRGQPIQVFPKQKLGEIAYIVSRPVAQALQCDLRSDIYFVHEQSIDENGHPCGGACLGRLV